MDERATGARGPPGGLGYRSADERGVRRGRRRRDRATIPSRAIVTSVANISGMSKRRAAGEVDEDAEAAVGAGPLADDRADDGERDADPQPAEDRRQRGRDLERRQDLAARRPERAGRARAARRRPSGCRPSSRSRPGRTRSARRSRPCRAAPARTTGRAAGRGRGSASAWAATRYGESDALDERPTGRARSRRRGRRPAPTTNPSAISTSVGQACGAIVPSVQRA